MAIMFAPSLDNEQDKLFPIPDVAPVIAIVTSFNGGDALFLVFDDADVE